MFESAESERDTNVGRIRALAEYLAAFSTRWMPIDKYELSGKYGELCVKGVRRWISYVKTPEHGDEFIRHLESVLEGWKRW